MYCLNNTNGPLCYYETEDINEEGKVIIFATRDEVDSFINLAIEHGISDTFFEGSLIINAIGFVSLNEGIYWKDIPEEKLFTREEEICLK